MLAGLGVPAERAVATPRQVPADTCPQTGLDELVVRGSVGQVHVVNAAPRVAVRVNGAGGFTRSGTTDGRGGLVMRGVPAGDASVTVGGGPATPVEVLAPGEHPDGGFYASQDMPLDALGADPVDGYLLARDCTRLSYRIELPAGPMPAGGYDVLVMYDGYSAGVRGGHEWSDGAFGPMTAEGYAVVGVNMRGSGCSGGAFDMMEQLVLLDGYDVIETVAAQAWSADVATYGGSWPGLSQLFLASTQPPSLAAIAPGVPVGDFYRDVAYPGGIENIGFGKAWATGRDTDNRFPNSTNAGVVNLTNDKPGQVVGDEDDPVCLANQALRGQNVDTAAAWAQHEFFDGYWERFVAPVEDIEVPTLIVLGWQDEQVGSRAARVLERFPDSTPVRLVGSNGGHTMTLRGDFFDELTTFYCVYLDDGCATTVEEYEAEGRVKVMLETRVSTAEARTSVSLPSLDAAGDGRRFVLGQDLLADDPDGSPASSSTFDYEPRASGWSQARQDMVTFTSAPLTGPDPLVMAGSASADLYIAADSNDVDLQVTLSEVRPDGNEMLVQSGWQRASHRHDAARSTPLQPFHPHTAAAHDELTPGSLELVRVELFPFAHAFRPGSSIRLTVNAPGGGSNPFPWAFGTTAGASEVTVAHDAGHRSALALPVLTSPADVAPALPDCLDTWWQLCRQVIDVNATADGVDADPGDGVCEVTAGAGNCSLRAAVQEANALVAGATIRLSPGTHELTIAGAGEDAGARGDLDITDDTLVDGRGATIDANGRDRVFDVRSGAAAILQDVTVTGGSVASEHGAGVRVGGCRPVPGGEVCSGLELSDARVTANGTIGSGGGVYGGPGTNVTIDGSTIDANNALSGGGVLTDGGLAVTDSAVNSNNASFLGGGVRATGLFRMANSSVIANKVTHGGPGGGLSLSTAPNFGAPPTLTGSVVIYNSAATGGGVHVEKALRLWWSTVAGNSATTGGDVATAGAGSVNLQASIVSHSQGGGSACAGSVVSSGRNLSDSTDNGACGLSVAPNDGDRTNVDPLLDAWGDLRAGSPAIGAAGLDGCPAVDLRGTARPQGTACDIGAIERPSP